MKPRVRAPVMPGSSARACIVASDSDRSRPSAPVNLTSTDTRYIRIASVSDAFSRSGSTSAASCVATRVSQLTRPASSVPRSDVSRSGCAAAASASCDSATSSARLYSSEADAFASDAEKSRNSAVATSARITKATSTSMQREAAHAPRAACARAGAHEAARRWAGREDGRAPHVRISRGSRRGRSASRRRLRTCARPTRR